MLQEQIKQGSLAVLRARWLNAKAEQPTLALTTHQAIRAIDREQLAETLSDRVDDNDPFDAYKLCEALEHYSRTLEAWAFISARLWLESEKNADLADLHQCSIDQYKRLTTQQEAFQQRVYAFCTSHHVLLRFHVITQTMDISAGAEVRTA